MKLLMSFSMMAAFAFSTPLLEERGNAILGIITDIAPECTSTEATGSAQYFVTDGPCTNVPPIPSMKDVPFLSFGTGFMNPKGQTCELQVFADAGCTGQFQGLANPSVECQNVGLTLASKNIGSLPGPKIGAKSIRLSCKTA